jgi:hypothetical protein
MPIIDAATATVTHFDFVTGEHPKLNALDDLAWKVTGLGNASK